MGRDTLFFFDTTESYNVESKMWQVSEALTFPLELQFSFNNGYNIALMIDQRVSEGERINLFSKPALTTTLPAQLAIKYKINIVPVYIERNNKNKFKVEIYDEVKSSNFKTKWC